MPHMATLSKPLMPRQGMAEVLKGTRADRLLLLAAIAGITLAWLTMRAGMASGPAVAEIYRGDTLLATYLLPGEGEPAIHFQTEGELGPTEITLDQQGARIATAPCSGQRCVRSGAHRHAGDFIACVPNRILVAIRGSDASRLDAVVE